MALIQPNAAVVRREQLVPPFQMSRLGVEGDQMAVRRAADDPAAGDGRALVVGAIGLWGV